MYILIFIIPHFILDVTANYKIYFGMTVRQWELFLLVLVAVPLVVAEFNCADTVLPAEVFFTPPGQEQPTPARLIEANVTSSPGMKFRTTLGKRVK